MSQYQSIPFPNGHSIDQVKRNAKRLRDEKNIPLNKALDQLASLALGLPEGKIKWPQAIKALEYATNYYRLPETFTVSQDAREAFLEGVIVSIDVKDAQGFKDTGPWVLDDHLPVLMAPTLICNYAVSCAEEDGRKDPTAEGWEYALEALMWPTLYRYAGKNSFRSERDVINDICERNYFPPDQVWIAGQIQSEQWQAMPS